MIRSAAPFVKPISTDGEMKFATAPSRSTPTSHCITPTSSVTISVSSM